MTASYTIADYIIDRLAALGAEHLFTVPGNYCAEFLSAADASGKIECIGTVNELEAGYAADAYARLRGIGVACVTYGVGSLSLINAIAGAFVERCPVVLLNGSPRADKAKQLVEQGVLFAHAIDTMRTDESIFRNITADTAVILDADDATARIDRVLIACITEKRPVYLEVRDGVWSAPCERPADPSRPLAPLPLAPDVEQDIEQSTSAAVATVLDLLGKAEHPVLWGGEELQRWGLQDAFEEIVELTHLPYATTLLGKAVISENNPQFVGVYSSVYAPGDTIKVVEGSDCLFALGTILTDFYGAIVAKTYDRMILAAGGAVRVGRAVYPRVPLDRFVHKLLSALREGGHTLIDPAQHTPPAGFEEAQRVTKWEARREAASREVERGASLEEQKITWDSFFDRLSLFVDDSTLVLADTSLGLFPSAELLVIRRSSFITQSGWLSIGYSVGAVVGAGEAVRAARPIVLTGDGGFQMVAQALSTLRRQRIPAVVFVFDNTLYAIEQLLVNKEFFKGPHAPPAFFNELSRWDYVSLASAFGARGFLVGTMAELGAALEEVATLDDVPALVAVQIEPRDLPREIARSVRPGESTELGEGPAGAFSPAGFD
ncbi:MULTISPECIES: alpha-keto acid decarboxylase family protein [Sorangium]|uniref:alpha-keto acid decarboxylase family protein n=1 Tax=Sorangium TaxID=39643 RepID=UPI003D9C1DE8